MWSVCMYLYIRYINEWMHEIIPAKLYLLRHWDGVRQKRKNRYCFRSTYTQTPNESRAQIFDCNRISQKRNSVYSIPYHAVCVRVNGWLPTGNVSKEPGDEVFFSHCVCNLPEFENKIHIHTHFRADNIASARVKRSCTRIHNRNKSGLK